MVKQIRAEIAQEIKSDFKTNYKPNVKFMNIDISKADSVFSEPIEYQHKNTAEFQQIDMNVE